MALPPARAGEPGTPWEVAGPVHPAALEAQAAEPAFVPAPRPGWARELVLDPVFLTWPPVLEGPACFLARTRLQSPGAGAVLRLRTPVRPLFITLGNLRLTPAAGAWDDTAREGSWEGPAPEGLPPLVLGLCVDPDETPPPYGLGARLDVQADSATPTRHGVIRAGPASPGGPGPGSSR
ncbi:MAG: hypothetical protein FJ098_09525 [Deltaproteobacteria bacterium]|nr:hypothetical protein [Deltaproteobacteria bacterium]